MVRVEIRYLVRDREKQKLRKADEIVNDLEREFWCNPFFSEASEYCIIVEDENGYATRESRRASNDNNNKRRDQTSFL